MKQLMLICAPVTSRSGYGAHARDLVHSFSELDRFDVKILDVPWGNCPRNALNPTVGKDKSIIDKILVEPRMDRQPDVYVDIRIPNEFETHGKFNIGITAGVETDVISPEWIESCNKMDLIIVPSEHSKKGIVDTIYDKFQDLPDGTKQKVDEIKVNKPVEVLFEGFDENIYKKLEVKEIDNNILDDINEKIPEDFAFLFVGQWTNGGYGEDRKDLGKLIKIFYEAFANKKKKPALILKTSGATFSILDKEECIDKINKIKKSFPDTFNLPNIYLLHGDLNDTELNSLYNHPKIKTFISLTHGEGFGRPLLEASAVGLPVIASGWSGHLDFLDSELSLLIGGDLTEVPDSVLWDKIIIKNSKWFNVNEDQVYKAMNYVFNNHFEVKRRAESLSMKNQQKFSLSLMTEKLKTILDNKMKSLPVMQQLKLPKLKKV